jgi:AraC-like DNA-binding protein
MDEPLLEVRRHESEHGRWELVLGRPDRRLRGLVHRYEGYDEAASPGPVLRQQVPTLAVPVIVNFGAPWRMSNRADATGISERRNSFVAGLAERSTFVVAEGEASCLQVDFTPIGAHLFFGVPMHELSNRIVGAEDVLGRDGDLVGRLEAAPTWESRFELLEDAILRRLAGAGRPAPEILWAWRALVHTGGAVPVGALAAKVGRSRRHLLAGFREHVGLGPKTVARIVRFGRAVRALELDPRRSFAELAFECGYFDQAHLYRDFRAFAGTTPRDFAGRLLPDGGVRG